MSKKEHIFASIFLFALAILPIIAVDMPRFYATGPIIIGIFGFLTFKKTYGFSPERNKALLSLCAGITGLALLSVLWSVAPDTSLDRTKKLAILLASCVALGAVARNIPLKAIKPYLWLLPVGFIVACALAAFELSFDKALYTLIRGAENSNNISTSVYNRASVALALLGMPIAYITYRIKPHWIGPLAIFAALLLPLSLGQSQSAQLALACGLLCFMVFPVNKNWPWVASVLFITAFTIGAPFIMPYLFDHFAMDIAFMPLIGGDAGYTGERLEIWDFVSRYALQNPLTGHGIEATRTIEHFDTQMIFHKGDTVLHPHNYALQFWMEFGLLGALLCSGFCAYILHLIKNLKTVIAKRLLVSTFAAALCVSAMSYGIWQSWWIGMLFTLLAICIIINRMEEERAA